MSPGTSVEIGVSCGRSIPARSTAVVALTIAFSSSAALLERNSCQKRSSVLSSTIALKTMIVLSDRSSGAAKITSVNNETMLTANSTPLNGVTNAWNSCWYQAGGFSWDTSLGPYCPSRSSTCSCVKPPRPASSRLSASSGAQSHNSGSGELCLVSLPLRRMRSSAKLPTGTNTLPIEFRQLPFLGEKFWQNALDEHLDVMGRREQFRLF